MKILKKIHEIFLMIPYYLRGLVVFAALVLLSMLVNKFFGRVDYWDTEIGKEQLAEIKKMAKDKKDVTVNPSVTEQIEVDTKNNTVNGVVKENTKFGEFPKFKKEQDTKIFTNLKNDIVFGSMEAPITVIDYSSFSCPHCKDFYLNTMDKVKNNYIDTNKIKYVKRMIIQKETLLGVILLHCTDNNDTRYSLIRDLYQNSDKWISGSNRENVLKEIALRNGFTEASLIDCIKNKTLAQSMMDKQNEELNNIALFYVPTIFINGTRVGNGMSYEELSAKIDEVSTIGKK